MTARAGWWLGSVKSVPHKPVSPSPSLLVPQTTVSASGSLVAVTMPGVQGIPQLAPPQSRPHTTFGYPSGSPSSSEQSRSRQLVCHGAAVTLPHPLSAHITPHTIRAPLEAALAPHVTDGSHALAAAVKRPPRAR